VIWDNSFLIWDNGWDNGFQKPLVETTNNGSITVFSREKIEGNNGNGFE